ncbi:MAG: hypothetical protein PVF83_04985 [Anaerolineales bacterium]
MTNSTLFEGVVVVIDDEIFNSESEDIIVDTCEKLEEANFPLVKYENVPDENIVKNLINVSFIILDWDFVGVVEGLNIGISDLKRRRKEEVINFIKNIYSLAFLPIFIFSNQSVEDIIADLEHEKLYKSNQNQDNCIFIQNKASEVSIFDVLNDWISKNSSIYVLKNWEKSIHKAKNNLFWSFYDIAPSWPKIMTQTIKKDDQDLDMELGAMITKNMISRVDNYGFEEERLIGQDPVSEEDVKKVLEGEKFIDGKLLNKEYSYNGDIYFHAECEGEKKYYMNIRPQCDLRGTSHGLYCIRGKEINFSGDNVTEDNGQILEKVNEVIVYGICEGKTIKFFLKELKLIKFNATWKNRRIGRLLPPHITRINQKFSFYILREGLPRLPDVIFNKQSTD